MGDYNDANIIVDPTERRVAGVIDFGDAVHNLCNKLFFKMRRT